jgi:catechol 2,3-dioxygenase-like lactoylglutathione lyase family enzyme
MPGAPVWGLEVQVSDLQRARRTYVAGLGFVVEEDEPDRGWAILRNGETRLVLVATEENAGPPAAADPTLTILVGSLSSVADSFLKSGGRIPDREQKSSAVGPYLEAEDADGHTVHLLAAPWDDVEAGDPPQVFNIGMNHRDLGEIEEYYARLGFEVSSREYLPETLPLGQPGGQSLVYHRGSAEPQAGAARTPRSAIILEAEDLRPVVAGLQAAGVPLELSTTFSGRETRVQLRDPGGYLLKLAQREITWRPLRDWRSAGSSYRNAIPASRAFERLKMLEGGWRASSTKGWGARVTFGVGGGGSFVAETIRFEGNPLNTMVTVYHMDGDVLMLTHYCEAGNQPRLVATDFGRDGKSITFTFLDATNLPSRAHGHMGSAVISIPSADRFTSRWSWFAEGRESWMEEIAYARVPEEERLNAPAEKDGHAR